MTTYSLDELFSYLEPVCCSMSSSNCWFLTCIQISQEADQVVWYSHLFQNFPQFIVIHTVKGFGIVNKAEIDVLLELSCFFHDRNALLRSIPKKNPQGGQIVGLGREGARQGIGQNWSWMSEGKLPWPPEELCRQQASTSGIWFHKVTKLW